MSHLPGYVLQFLLHFISMIDFISLVTRTKPFQGKLCFCLLQLSPHNQYKVVLRKQCLYYLTAALLTLKVYVCYYPKVTSFPFFLLIYDFFLRDQSILLGLSLNNFSTLGRIATKLSTELFPLLPLQYKTRTTI